MCVCVCCKFVNMKRKLREVAGGYGGKERGRGEIVFREREKAQDNLHVRATLLLSSVAYIHHLESVTSRACETQVVVQIASFSLPRFPGKPGERKY